jgi:hypothetical protein
VGLLEELSIVTVGPGCHLTCRLANRDQIQDGGAREDDVRDQERAGGAGMDQLLDAFAKRECRTSDEHAESGNECPEVGLSPVPEGMLVVRTMAAAELSYEEEYVVGGISE